MHIFIRLGSFSKLQCQAIDLLGQQPDLVQVKLTNFSDSIREIIYVIGQNDHHLSEISWSLSNDDSKFALSALAHEAPVRSKRRRTRLIFSALDLDLMHVRSLCNVCDRRCIGCIVLLSFDKRRHVDRRNWPYIMATSCKAALEMAGGTSFHRDDARRLLVQSLL